MLTVKILIINQSLVLVSMMFNLLIKINEISISIRQSEVDSLTDMVEEAKTAIIVCLSLLTTLS